MANRGQNLGLLGRRGECELLDRLLVDMRSGRSRVLVLRGEAGIGKTALLEFVRVRATGCRVAHLAGVESERELAYAGLHQLCAPFLDRLERLPAPQRDVLGTAFGLREGSPPDRFLVGLAVLSLLAQVAEDEPLVCLVDDAQWLDQVSVQVLGFVARRLLADRIVMVFALRQPAGGIELAGLPELAVSGLREPDARALLDSVVKGPVDGRVRDRIVAETHGNPLALLELPLAWTTAELAEGFERPDVVTLAARIEEGFLRQLDGLPGGSQRLLLIAAAEPLGAPTLLWRAAGLLGLDGDLAAEAEATGLIEFGARIRFRHPLVRSAVYRSASGRERQDVHRVLAEATDPILDPDRRAWHRAHATVAPDEDVAADLERSAGRAQAHGGLVAAAAFLEQAALFTPEPGRRAQRELAAARAKRDAGALNTALALLEAAEAGPQDELREAEIEHLRGKIAFDQRRGLDAARLLLQAARRMAPFNADLTRETYLEALSAAIWASGPGGPDVVEVASAARAAPPARTPARAIDLVLDALAARFTEGYTAAVSLLARALEAVLALDASTEDVGRMLWLMGNRAGGLIAPEIWDFEAAWVLAKRQVQLAREAGALVQLQFALNFLATHELLAGDLAAAEAAINEDRLVAEATGNPPVGFTAMLLAAYRGYEAPASELIATTARAASARGQGRVVNIADYASAVLHNGLGQYDAARASAGRVFERDFVGYLSLAVVELAEAASRTGDTEQLEAVLRWSAERARATPTQWALGIDARLRAFNSDGDAAAQLYRESIERLASTSLRVDLARSHLLFGEWLRRTGDRVDARLHLRTAHDMLITVGLGAFAERARRELLATGGTVRRRTVDYIDELTDQEFHIARLARDGLSNQDIATQLFLSPRTVEWHLRKVFIKLEIRSRRQLRDVQFALAPA